MILLSLLLPNTVTMSYVVLPPIMHREFIPRNRTARNMRRTAEQVLIVAMQVID